MQSDEETSCLNQLCLNKRGAQPAGHSLINDSSKEEKCNHCTQLWKVLNV